MWLKAAGAACVVLSCTAMGFLKSLRLNGRLRELTELKRLLGLLEGMIRFGGGTLEEAFEVAADRGSPPYSGFFLELAAQMKECGGKTLGQLWQKAMETKLGASGLSEDEKAVLRTLGRDLGFLDREAQLKALALSEEQLEEARERLLEELPAKTKLYNYLGILAGVFITILLI